MSPTLPAARPAMTRSALLAAPGTLRPGHEDDGVLDNHHASGPVASAPSRHSEVTS